MESTTRTSSALIVAAVLLGLPGCTREPELEPASGATELEGDIAYTDAAAVQILAKGDDWEGDQDVLQQVTPVYLSIHNRGQWPVLVQYSRMWLRSPSGRAYAALPPFEVVGTGDTPELADNYRLMPRVEYRGFAVAPFYASVYSSSSTATQQRWETPEDYRERYRYWQTQGRRPSQEMLEWALPEGVVHQGGKVSGYVYFPRVRTDRVTFNLEVANADTGQRLGLARIPFEPD